MTSFIRAKLTHWNEGVETALINSSQVIYHDECGCKPRDITIGDLKKYHRKQFNSVCSEFIKMVEYFLDDYIDQCPDTILRELRRKIDKKLFRQL